MVTGIGAPFSSFWVWALNALQNSMMLRPRWPSAGPIGGDGLAAPAGTCNLRYPATFFAIKLLLFVSGFVVRLRAPGERPVTSHGYSHSPSYPGLTQVSIILRRKCFPGPKGRLRPSHRPGRDRPKAFPPA